MGVGHFRSDFNGTGDVVHVSGPDLGDAEYEAYAKAERDEGEEPMPREDWTRMEFDDAHDEMTEVLIRVCRSVGMTPAVKDRGRTEAADFDGEFSLIAEGEVLAVGWRGWQDDVVVGIGPTSSFGDFAGDPGSDAIGTVREHGLSPATFRTLYDGAVAGLTELVRLSLVQHGIKTFTPTSAWTSRSDAAPEDAGARIAALRVSVEADLARLALRPEDALPKADAEERLALARVILAADPAERAGLPRVLIGTYEESGTVALWQPGTGEGSGLMSSATLSPEMKGYMAALPRVEGIAAVPFAPETEAWYAAQQARGRGNRVVVSAEQYAEITGEDCVVTWMDSELDATGEITLHEVSRAPTP